MRGVIVLAAVVSSGCVIRDRDRLATTAQVAARTGGGGRGQLRLIAQDGRVTGWMEAADLWVVGDLLCWQPGTAAWRSVEAIEVSELTDDNIVGVLVDLPPSIDVVDRMGGVIELETHGRDVGAWLRSAAHDPDDREVRRYRIWAWSTWSRPMTWRELAGAAHPRAGWPLAGATAETQRVNVGATIAISVVGAVAVVAAGALVGAARIRIPTSDGPPPDGWQRRRSIGDSWPTTTPPPALPRWPPVMCDEGGR